MAYRIHFTVQDLARTRVAEAPMPLSELGLAARMLQDRSQPLRLDAWRRGARARLSPQARMALSLFPPVGWAPLLTPPPDSGRPEELLEHVYATRRREFNEQLAFIAERQRMPSFAYHLTNDTALYKRFVNGLTDLYGVLIRPYETQHATLFMADRTVRMRQFLDGGIERVLAQANPRWVRWETPVLEIQTANGVDFDLHLEGEGVVLMPSMFCARTIAGGDPQTIVTYPAGDEQPLRRLTTFAPEGSEAISALLGRTRAAVLIAIAERPGCSTKELAALVGIAPASASEHATVLRRADLVSTVRHRNTAMHSPTGLGIALLNRPAQPTPSRSTGTSTAANSP